MSTEVWRFHFMFLVDGSTGCSCCCQAMKVGFILFHHEMPCTHNLIHVVSCHVHLAIILGYIFIVHKDFLSNSKQFHPVIFCHQVSYSKSSQPSASLPIFFASYRGLHLHITIICEMRRRVY